MADVPWSFTLAVVLGAATLKESAVVLPTYELCEATREAVIGLPPLGEGTAVCGVCTEDGHVPSPRPLSPPSTGGYPS